MSHLSRWQKLIGLISFLLLAFVMWLVVATPSDNDQIAFTPLSSTRADPLRIADPFDEDDLERLKKDVAYLQKEAVDALGAGHLTKADLAMQEADALIHFALTRSPGDLQLLDQDGCLHRNIAAAYQRASMNNQVEENLGDAERSFRLIISFDQDNSRAWKSLGDIYIMRNELDRAEQCVRKAIELDPQYKAARNDLIWILEQQ